MNSPGGKFLGGYGHFVRQFIVGYLLFCSAVLLALLVVDAVFPAARVYERLAGMLRSALPPPPAPAP